jgi:hypothetical protein
LGLVFGGIESRLFLGSNFGEDLARLAQLPAREKKPRRRKKRAPPRDSLAQRAALALLDLPAHVTASLAQEEPEEEEWRRIGGVLVAKGFVPQTMAVKASHSVRVSEDPLALESWAAKENQGDDSDAHLARQAWEALVWLDGRGQAWVNTVLYKMHGGILPALESCRLSFMGELAPLVLDVPLVLGWAQKMTMKMRAEATLRCGHPCDRRETVTPRTALEALLAGERRTAREDLLREQALELYSGTETGHEGACWWFQKAMGQA